MIKVIDKITDDFLKNVIGVYSAGSYILASKVKTYNVFISSLPNQAASILKQDMLSIGGDVAVHSNVVKYIEGANACLIVGTKKQFDSLIRKMLQQPYGLRELSPKIKSAILDYEKKNHFVKLRDGKELDLSITKIMGILNLTPDSFYDGGNYCFDTEKASLRAFEMIDEGALIIDLGAESTRPRAIPISIDEELKRLLPVLKSIRKKSNILISIDTYKSEVARICLEEGADIINDISGGNFDENMFDVAVKYNVPIILMHMQNNPQTMQDNPVYDNVINEILEYFEKVIKIALEKGIDKNKIILDPGIGFGKTFNHNFEIINSINEFKVLGFPILIGHSRKSFLSLENSSDRLISTLAVSSCLIEKNINILRVHDVREHTQILDVLSRIHRTKNEV